MYGAKIRLKRIEVPAPPPLANTGARPAPFCAPVLKDFLVQDALLQCGCGADQWVPGKVGVADCPGDGYHADEDAEGENRFAFPGLAVEFARRKRPLRDPGPPVLLRIQRRL
jgi:hypothetical protein